MEVRYAGREIERICTEDAYMRRRQSTNVCKKLRLRIAELHSMESFEDLRRGTGRWEQLTGDRTGQWSARLTANLRLIVVDEGGHPVVVTVIEITDYH